MAQWGRPGACLGALRQPSTELSEWPEPALQGLGVGAGRSGLGRCPGVEQCILVGLCVHVCLCRSTPALTQWRGARWLEIGQEESQAECPLSQARPSEIV